MPSAHIYQAFKRANCESLSVYADLRLRTVTLSKIRNCLGGKRRTSPFRVAAIYPGERKEKVGAQVELRRRKGSVYGLFMLWFITTSEAPPGLGRLADLINCLAESFDDRDVVVGAVFSYDREKVVSLFKPIQLAEQSVIFDEITGFRGVKRNPEGKLLYEMEVAIQEKRLAHTISFTQTVRLTEDLPLPLLGTASRISALALRSREVA